MRVLRPEDHGERRRNRRGHQRCRDCLRAVRVPLVCNECDWTKTIDRRHNIVRSDNLLMGPDRHRIRHHQLRYRNTLQNEHVPPSLIVQNKTLIMPRSSITRPAGYQFRVVAEEQSGVYPVLLHQHNRSNDIQSTQGRTSGMRQARIQRQQGPDCLERSIRRIIRQQHRVQAHGRTKVQPGRGSHTPPASVHKRTRIQNKLRRILMAYFRKGLPLYIRSRANGENHLEPRVRATSSTEAAVPIRRRVQGPVAHADSLRRKRNIRSEASSAHSRGMDPEHRLVFIFLPQRRHSTNSDRKRPVAFSFPIRFPPRC